VALNKKTADSYAFTVQTGLCDLPVTSGNTFSSDGIWEYAASGKSYATVTPGCAWNPSTGQGQPYVHLVDNGNYLLNVSVNGVPLTQLSATHPNTPVFLSAGRMLSQQPTLIYPSTIMFATVVMAPVRCRSMQCAL
jgi:hypothetical protein